MNSQDSEVLNAVAQALKSDEECWLATVVAVHGSSPRPPGSMALFLPRGLGASESSSSDPEAYLGSQIGSLSGGCVEEELVTSIHEGAFPKDQPSLLEYGVSAEENARLGLPCGGHLTIFLQCLQPERDLQWVLAVLEGLNAREGVQRSVSAVGETHIHAGKRFEPLSFMDGELRQSFGPRQRMLLVGAGQLAVSVAELALALDYDVMVCDPRENARKDWHGPPVPVLADMPDDAVREYASDSQSVVITLTHDPRIDDMALMEALDSEAWYVGALGSQKTTDARKERLTILGLSEASIGRLHAPVGIDIGSKTAPEIAVSILAELTKLRRRGVDSF